MARSTKGYRKPAAGEYILREGWFWPDKPCVKGHSAPRNRFKHCVACVREYRAANGHFCNETSTKWRRKNAFRLAENRRDWNRNNPTKTLLAAAKRASKQKAIPFDLKAEDILIPDRCPVLGLAIDRGAGARTDGSPSLDRIVPALGYVRGNVIVVSWRANRLKQDATFDEMRRIAAFYGRLESRKAHSE